MLSVDAMFSAFTAVVMIANWTVALEGNLYMHLCKVEKKGLDLFEGEELSEMGKKGFDFFLSLGGGVM